MRLDHASRLAANWLAVESPAPWRELDGTAVLADLAGFTRLTETLAGLGPEGAEVLHRTMTLCFSSLLGASVALGGDIIGFAGDAALVWFHGDGHELRAVEAAVSMPASLARLPAAVTGGKRLRVSVGVHSGTVTAMLAGSPQCRVLLCGPVISALVALENSAGAGQVVASRSLAEHLPASWRGSAVGTGVTVKRRPPKQPVSSVIPATMTVPADVDPAVSERLLSLLSPAVRDVMSGDITIGDHRSASVAFVAVPGVDELLASRGPDAAHAALNHVATLIGRVAGELSVTWLDADVGIGGVKLMLAAGAPQAIEDDEGRLLLALRRILDESDVVLRAGAQRGRVFSVALGVPGRRTYTVLGDPVNVAARALDFAGDRELVVGDRLGVADRPFVTAVGLGAMTLKNHVRPIAMWRVTAVETAARQRGGQRSTAAGSGRPAERERIATAWKRAVDGSGSSLSIIGEPGMGATDLLAEAEERAGSAATLIVADSYRQQIPYGTIAMIVLSMARIAGADENDGGWAWLAGFAEHLDDLTREWIDDGRRALQQRPNADEIDPMTAARRARTVLTALIEIAAPRPWLLAIDDLDSVDGASRLILRELVERAADERWLVLTTMRPGSPPLHEGDDPNASISLEPFDEDEATRFVLDVEPRLRDDQVARIVAAGKGNQFVLEELARNPQGRDLPDSLERLGAARIDALPVAMRRLVRDAATFGMNISLATIAEVLGRPDLADPAAWADAASVLRPTESGMLAFRHDAYRIAAHESLPFQRRRELHSAIADHLAAQPDTSGAILARHYQEAGRAREAFPLAVAAGRAAKSTGALVEASDLLGRAAGLAREVDRPALGPLLVEQGDTLMRLGDLPGAERAFTAAGRVLSDPLGYATMCSHRADLALRRTQYAQARRWAQKGLSLTVPLASGALEVRGKLLLDDAAALHFMGRNAESLRLATEALAAALQADNQYLEGLAHLHLEMVHSVLLQPEARAHGDEAIRIFESIGHDRYLGDALINSGLTAMNAGRWDEALERYDRAAAIVARTGDTTDAAIIDLNVGFLLLRKGRYAEAETHGLRASRVFATAGLELSAAYAHHLLSRIAAAEGQFGDAEELMATARATFVRLGVPEMVADSDVASIDRLLLAGRADDAAALADAIEQHMPNADETVELSFRLFRGIAQARTGDPAGGAARIVGALETARERKLLYEEFLCLVALIDIEDTGGPPAPADARVVRDAIAGSLGQSWL